MQFQADNLDTSVATSLPTLPLRSSCRVCVCVMGQYQTRVSKSSEGDQGEEEEPGVREAEESQEAPVTDEPFPIFGSPIESELGRKGNTITAFSSHNFPFTLLIFSCSFLFSSQFLSSPFALIPSPLAFYSSSFVPPPPSSPLPTSSLPPSLPPPHSFPTPSLLPTPSPLPPSSPLPPFSWQ